MSVKGESLGSAELAPAPPLEAVASAYSGHFAALPSAAVALALTFGLILVFLTAPFQAPGEFQHFYRAYQISEGQWTAVYHDDVGGGDLPSSLQLAVDPFYNLRFDPKRKTSAAQINEAMKIPLNAGDRKFIPFITALYSPLGYIPQSTAIALGRWAGLGPLKLMYLGRLANLLCWTVLVYSSLRIAPCCRRPILLLMFMPMSVFLAASLSIDAMTNGLALLVAAIALRYAAEYDTVDSEQRMGWGAVLAFTLATMIVTVAKIAYLPLAGLILLVPARKLGGPSKCIAIAAAILILNLAGLMAWEPFTHGLDVKVHDYANVSPRGQIEYLLSHPAAFATVSISTVLTNFWFILKSFVGRLGWVDTQLSLAFLMVYLAAIVGACIPAEGDPSLPRKRTTIIVLLCAIASIAAVGVLNYIYWTPVGAKNVTGMQGRYFIPIAPAIVILLGELVGKGIAQAPVAEPSRPAEPRGDGHRCYWLPLYCDSGLLPVLRKPRSLNMGKNNSLSARYPWRFEVPLLVLASGAMLIVGLSLPLMKVEKLIFWKNDYSVFTGVWSLMKDNQILLAAILFFFSMVFPFVKLTSLLILWWWPLTETRRKALLKWLAILGKWSMLDVFVVAILIVLVKLGPLASVEPQPGLYFFCFAILASMLTTMYVEYLAKH